MNKDHKFHSENLREISRSLNTLEASIKNCLKNKEMDQAKVHTNIHTFLTGAWIEVSFYKLINEYQFNDLDRRVILNNSSNLEEKWRNVLRFSFLKVVFETVTPQMLDDDEVVKNLDRTHQHMFNDIASFIMNDLKDAIFMRNKIAHGQWHYVFNNEVTKVDSNAVNAVRKNHYFSSRKRLETVKLIVELINRISISPEHFMRTFDTTYSKIEEVKIRYSEEKYQKNIRTMIEKNERARLWQRKNGY